MQIHVRSNLCAFLTMNCQPDSLATMAMALESSRWPVECLGMPCTRSWPGRSPPPSSHPHLLSLVQMAKVQDGGRRSPYNGGESRPEAHH